MGNKAGLSGACLFFMGRKSTNANEVQPVTLSAYNRRMLRSLLLFISLLVSSVVVVMPAYSYGQSAAKKSSATRDGEAQHALGLAESGHCTQALPALKKLIRQVTDKDLKKRIGLDGAHCAMHHNLPYDALDI